ncbi:protein EMBRYO DEFECTIVE 514-like [Cucurbita pepo subsp. pepo]|uniref:protein EMBRYO DEFECTIVE 514-like n=1 Tax=Cucurbita pepo subsp. pepo TaxID=3664 RepID=UPI000C9D90F8|nr:protein EMBRYO DEFECTIVE 514-like [Cucurbita pepo subsp. pepo]
MAEETIPQPADNNQEVTNAEDMELENTEPGAEPKGSNDEANEAAKVTNGDANSKRERDEESADGSVEEAKKQKMEKSVEEGRIEKAQGDGKGEEEPGPVTIGPKSFRSSRELFDHFYKFLHHWPAYLNVNQYEKMMLLDLLKKGHAEPEKKIGCGIHSFQIRNHPIWKNKCFFLIREDESVDDFSFRKCVDHILPLPENLKGRSDANKAFGGGKHRGGSGGGGRGGGGGGRGRGGGGGRWRN